MDKRFYSVRELALASGFSPGTIQNRINQGEIFAVQSARRGAYRIPASSYRKYLATLGIEDEAPTFLPPTDFELTSSAELLEREIQPALERSGYRDMPSLLAAVESDPGLFEQYRDAIHVYTEFLAARAVEHREMVAV
jgi:hypothetical protein